METSRFLKQILSIFITLLSVVALTSCVSVVRIDGPYMGKVIDSATKLPLEGVVVHGTWVKRHLGGGSDYHDSYEMLTNKNGEFRIPGQGLLVLSEIEELHFILLKAGYEQISFYWSKASKESKFQTDRIVWNGNRPTFNLRKMTMEERRKRVLNEPDGPANKQKLFRLESNKEMIEAGRPPETLYKNLGD